MFLFSVLGFLRYVFGGRAGPWVRFLCISFVVSFTVGLIVIFLVFSFCSWLCFVLYLHSVGLLFL